MTTALLLLSLALTAWALWSRAYHRRRAERYRGCFHDERALNRDLMAARERKAFGAVASGRGR